jgi:hypothetical protein
MRIFLVLKASYGASSIANYGSQSPAGLNLITVGIDNGQKDTDNCGHADPCDTIDFNDSLPGKDNSVSSGTTQSGLALY